MMSFSPSISTSQTLRVLDIARDLDADHWRARWYRPWTALITFYDRKGVLLAEAYVHDSGRLLEIEYHGRARVAA